MQSIWNKNENIIINRWEYINIIAEKINKYISLNNLQHNMSLNPATQSQCAPFLQSTNAQSFHLPLLSVKHENKNWNDRERKKSNKLLYVEITKL